MFFALTIILIMRKDGQNENRMAGMADRGSLANDNWNDNSYGPCEFCIVPSL